MKGQYRTKTGWRVFILIGGPALIWLFIYLLVYLTKQDTDVMVWVVVVPICVGMIGLMMYGIGDALIGYYEIGDDFVAQRTIFGKKIIPLNDIKGVAVDENYIRLLPKPGRRGINISAYVQKTNDIVTWAYNNFEDHDVQQAEKEDIEILKEISNDHDGDHHDKLESAKKISKWLNWSGYCIGFWVLFYPSPAYDVAVVAAMLVPVIILISIILFKGFLRFNGFDNSRYPVMTYPFIMPIVGLGMRALLDFEILDHGTLWIQALSTCLIIVLVMVLLAKEFSLRKWKSLLMVLLFACFTYAYTISAMIIINCRFDETAAQIFMAKILNKETSSGKSTEYYLDLSPWGPRTEHEKVSVGLKAYDGASVGDTVEVYLYKGRLNAKWFQVGV